MVSKLILCWEKTMKKGFKDIEEFFLQAEAKRISATRGQKKQLPRREQLVNQIKNLNEKLKGKDRKIKELYREIATLRNRVEELESAAKENALKREELRRVEELQNLIEKLKSEVGKLKGEIAEKDRELEKLRSQELPKARVELFIEVALNSLTEIVEKKGNKVLFSKRFRKDMVKEASVRPFLLSNFVSALTRIDSNSRLLRRDSKHDVYRLRVTSPYGEYRAIYLKMDSDTLKFVRFGQRDSIYQELDASGWKFE